LRVRWTAPALQNKDAQIDYIMARNPYAAARLDEEIITQVINLQVHPELGRAGRVIGTRELYINRTPYLVIYRIGSDTVDILRVLHAAQKWPPK
jgi:toxin ParE1/3/4